MNDPPKMVHRSTGVAGTCLFGGCKCNPKTFTPWEDVGDDTDDKTHIVEGAPVLSTDHQLTCMYGGVITFTDKEIK